MKTLFEEVGILVFERGWLSSNNVLFASHAATETLLVDTGYASHAAQTVTLVRNALRGRTLNRIVNTHLHSDHCGGNHALQQAFGCAIDVPSGEAQKVDSWNEETLSFRATGQFCPQFQRAGSISPGDVFLHGDSRWRVLAAPGHDPHSVVLYEPDAQLLISADALWSNGFGVVFSEIVGEPGFDDVRQTLEMLASLAVRCVIPGHGAPFADFEAAVVRAFKRLRGMTADPAKHARHAAKVLIKFHLLEMQSCSLQELDRWMDNAPYFEVIHRGYFGSINRRAWRLELLNELIDSGTLGVDGLVIHNR